MSIPKRKGKDETINPMKDEIIKDMKKTETNKRK